MWKILRDSCARRDVYKIVNRTDLFPLPFVRLVGLKMEMLQLEELPFGLHD